MSLSPKYVLDRNTGGHAPTYRERKPHAWSRFYHSDYLLAFPLEETPYTFFSAQQIVLGFFGGSASAPKSKSVDWDRNRTQVTSARLGIRAHTNLGPSNYIVNFNDNDVHRKDFPWGLEQEDKVTVDVTEFLVNGMNKMLVTFERPLAGATLTFTITLYVGFAGVPPGENRWDELVIWIMEHPYEVAGVAGVGMAVVGGAIYLSKKGEKKVKRK